MSAKSSSPIRRGFGAVTFPAAQLAAIGSADAQSSNTNRADLPKMRPGTNTSFVAPKLIDAGRLNVGYAAAGLTDGPVVSVFTAGPMTSTPTSMSRRCQRRRAIVRSFRTFAVMARRAFSRTRRIGMVSRRPLPSI
jgi:hypothetical protein